MWMYVAIAFLTGCWFGALVMALAVMAGRESR